MVQDAMHVLLFPIDIGMRMVYKQKMQETLSGFAVYSKDSCLPTELTVFDTHGCMIDEMSKTHTAPT